MLSFDEFLNAEIGPPAGAAPWTEAFNSWPKDYITKSIINHWTHKYELYKAGKPLSSKKEVVAPSFRIINSKKSNALL